MLNLDGPLEQTASRRRSPLRSFFRMQAVKGGVPHAVEGSIAVAEEDIGAEGADDVGLAVAVDVGDGEGIVGRGSAEQPVFDAEVSGAISKQDGDDRGRHKVGDDEVRVSIAVEIGGAEDIELRCGRKHGGKVVGDGRLKGAIAVAE